MDYGLAPCVAEAIEEATERGALGYIPDPWKKEVARSCAAWQRRYGWEVDPTCIRPVPDVLEAFEVFLREDRCAPATPSWCRLRPISRS